MTVNVNVEGSVVAERDLAQRIRQELIRTAAGRWTWGLRRELSPTHGLVNPGCVRPEGKA